LRPTDFCHLLPIQSPTRVLGSRLVFRPSKRSGHSRDEEPDVSRRPSSLRPDRRFSMGVIAPGLSSLHVSRKRNTFRSWPLTPLSPGRVSRAVLSDDLRDQRRGLGCVLPPPREGCRRRNNPRCLPSVAHTGSCPARHRSRLLTTRRISVSPTNWSGLVR